MWGKFRKKAAEPIFDIYLNNTNNRSNILYIPLAMEKKKNIPIVKYGLKMK